MGIRDLLRFSKTALKNRQPAVARNPEELFLFCLFSMIGKLVTADGVISEEEISAVSRFIEDAFQLDTSQEKRARKYFREAQTNSETFSSYLEQFKTVFGDNVQAIDLLIDTLVQVSVADGEFSEDEETLVRQAATALGVSPNHYRRLKFSYLNNPQGKQNEDFYNLLGVSPDSQNEEIIASYKTLSETFSPEVVMRSGVPKAFLRYAQNRFQRLEQAFAIVMKERGKSIPRN